MTPAADRPARPRTVRAATAVLAVALLAGCSAGADGTTDETASAGSAPSTTAGDGPTAGAPEPTASAGTVEPEQTAAETAGPEQTEAAGQTGPALSSADVEAVLAQVQVDGLAGGASDTVGDELTVCGAPEGTTTVAGGELLARQLGTPGQEVVFLEAMVFPDAAAAEAAAPAVVSPAACDGVRELDSVVLRYAGGQAVEAGDAAVETVQSGTAPQLPDGAVDVTWVVLQGNVVWRVTGGAGSPDEARSRELLTAAADAVETGLQQG